MRRSVVSNAISVQGCYWYEAAIAVSESAAYSSKAPAQSRKTVGYLATEVRLVLYAHLPTAKIERRGGIVAFFPAAISTDDEHRCLFVIAFARTAAQGICIPLRQHSALLARSSPQLVNQELRHCSQDLHHWPLLRLRARSRWSRVESGMADEGALPL